MPAVSYSRLMATMRRATCDERFDRRSLPNLPLRPTLVRPQRPLSTTSTRECGQIHTTSNCKPPTTSNRPLTTKDDAASRIRSQPAEETENRTGVRLAEVGRESPEEPILWPSEDSLLRHTRRRFLQSPSHRPTHGGANVDKPGRVAAGQPRPLPSGCSAAQADTKLN